LGTNSQEATVTIGDGRAVGEADIFKATVANPHLEGVQFAVAIVGDAFPFHHDPGVDAVGQGVHQDATTKGRVQVSPERSQEVVWRIFAGDGLVDVVHISARATTNNDVTVGNNTDGVIDLTSVNKRRYRYVRDAFVGAGQDE